VPAGIVLVLVVVLDKRAGSTDVTNQDSFAKIEIRRQFDNARRKRPPLEDHKDDDEYEPLAGPS
jgi:hypothetical protein